MTLYTFDKDSAGKSACNGPCATMWPPLAAPAGAKLSGDFSVITRDDGSQQIAHKGRPLYHFAADNKPGDKNGDGNGGVWHVVGGGKAAGAAGREAPKPSSSGQSHNPLSAPGY
jgi:predicted lipoprotein with Yx(FWY)xxD motif